MAPSRRDARGPAAILVAALVLAASPVAAAAQRITLGRSVDGRPIVALRAGDGHGPVVLVVGCIHGVECAGTAITRLLVGTRFHADLWVVPDLNPDGLALGVRQDARGVDLNRNWSWGWLGGGRPWDTQYPGPRPFSEPETRIARDLILRIHPAVTIWYHQHMDLVWAWGPATAFGRRYARAVGMRLYHHPGLRGTAPSWQNHHPAAGAAFVVELPAGRLSAGAASRHVRAVGAVVAAARRAVRR